VRQLSTTRDCGSGTGSARSGIASIKLKMAVLAPIPRAGLVAVRDQRRIRRVYNHQVRHAHQRHHLSTRIHILADRPLANGILPKHVAVRIVRQQFINRVPASYVVPADLESWKDGKAASMLAVRGRLGHDQEGRSMSLEEAIIDKVRRLPPAKQEEVLRFADGLQDSARARIVQSWDRTIEMKWIDLNRGAYEDQCVAVEGDRLVAAGNDPLKVLAAAKEEGIRTPFVVHMLPEDPLPFVPGW
jgi:hypothetical protein